MQLLGSSLAPLIVINGLAPSESLALRHFSIGPNLEGALPPTAYVPRNTTNFAELLLDSHKFAGCCIDGDAEVWLIRVLAVIHVPD